MSQGSEPLDDILERAVRRDELALLQLARRVTSLLRELGAYTVERDWSVAAGEIAALAVERHPQRTAGAQSGEAFFDSLVKNAFWARILDLMADDHPAARDLFFPAVRRLLSRWDGSGRYESEWDDMVQDTAYQLWSLWGKGGVEKPWSLLCTVAKRRYLDRVRATRPTDELDDRIEAETNDGDAPGDGRFTDEALSTLEEDERSIIVRMDIEGQTRAEIAGEMGLTEGQVLSLRRAGLRRIWRWMGSALPPPEREVWEEMFKGSKRATPAQVADKLGLEEDVVMQRLAMARQRMGLE